MGIHIADDRGFQSGVAQGIAHHAKSALMFRGGLGHVKGVRTHAITDNLGQDGSATTSRVFQFFENQNARAFTDDKAIAILVPGTAGARGIVVARRECAHGSESADAHGRNRGFGAARYHDVRVIVLNDAERVADRVCAGRTGGGRRFVGPFRAGAHGDVSSS